MKESAKGRLFEKKAMVKIRDLDNIRILACKTVRVGECCIQEHLHERFPQVCDKLTVSLTYTARTTHIGIDSFNFSNYKDIPTLPSHTDY